MADASPRDDPAEDPKVDQLDEATVEAETEEGERYSIAANSVYLELRSSRSSALLILFLFLSQLSFAMFASSSTR